MPDREVEAPPQATDWRGTGFYVGAIITALFLLRLLGAAWESHFPAVWPDATFPKEGYLAVAAKSPFRPSFYNAYRPIGYPFFLWIFGRNTQLTVIAQAALYCAGIGALIATALRTLRSRAVAVITAVLIAGVAVQAKYALWTTQILSESLAMSLGLVGLAAWWRFSVTPSRGRAVRAFAVTVAWLVVRDANVLPGTVVVVPAVLLVAWLGTGLGPRIRKTLVVGAVVVVLTAGYAYFAQSAAHRTLSFHNVVGMRILPDPELEKWFTRHGMPLDDALRSRTGKSGMDDTFYANTDPAFTRYRNWAYSAGPRTFALSMVVFAPHYVDLMHDDLPSILRGDLSYYDTQSVYDRLPREMPLQLGGPTTRKGLTVWLAVGAAALAALAALALARRRGLGPVLFGTAAIVLSLVELYTTWAGDPVEMERHMVGALIRLAVVIVIMVGTAVDTVLDAWRSRPPREEPPPPPMPWEGEFDADYASQTLTDA